MNDIKKNHEEEEIPKKTATKVKVTSRATIDFPGLEWGINAGEVRELPEDPAAQATILSSEFIKKVN